MGPGEDSGEIDRRNRRAVESVEGHEGGENKHRELHRAAEMPMAEYGSDHRRAERVEPARWNRNAGQNRGTAAAWLEALHADDRGGDHHENEARDPHDSSGGGLIVEGGDAPKAWREAIGRVDDVVGKAENRGESHVD